MSVNEHVSVGQIIGHPRTVVNMSVRYEYPAVSEYLYVGSPAALQPVRRQYVVVVAVAFHVNYRASYFLDQRAEFLGVPEAAEISDEDRLVGFFFGYPFGEVVHCVQRSVYVGSKYYFHTLYFSNFSPSCP